MISPTTTVRQRASTSWPSRSTHDLRLFTLLSLRCRRCRFHAKPAIPPWAPAHRGKWGQLTPWKMDKKLKSENIQKSIFSVLQNAPFCSQIFKIFFASGGKGKWKNGWKIKKRKHAKEHFSLLQNAPFCSQIFKIFFASGDPPKQNPADVFESHRSLPFLLQNRPTPGIPRTANWYFRAHPFFYFFFSPHFSCWFRAVD